MYYDRYRLPYPEAMTEDLIARTRVSGQGRLLDLACGTGQLAFPLRRSFAEVWAAAKTMNAFLEANRPDRKAIIFSKRFWAGEAEYKPDPKTGKVDLSGHHNISRPSDGDYDYINFDYGLYDEKSGNWWHASHCDFPLSGDPECGRQFGQRRMTVYESNLQSYSMATRDFDSQVFCVAVGRR